MTKEQAIEQLKHDRDLCNFDPFTGESEPISEDCRKSAEALDMAIKLIEQQPSDDCVSRQAVLDKAYAYGSGLEPEGYCVDVEDIQALPPVTPTQCIATVQFSKERIELECVHGTCKDCFYYNIDEDGHGYHCEKYGHTRFPVYADFYCADFEKRGAENDIS